MGRRAGVRAAAAALTVLVTGCSVIGQAEAPPDGRQPPVARDAAGCIASVRAVIRTAPPTASDPATGTWLGRADHLRDEARALGDQQVAGELDWAGARVAMQGFPPQLAIVPVRATCTIAYSLDHQAAAAPAVSAARAWLAANPPPAQAGRTAGIITQWRDRTWPCPTASPSHGSDVSMGCGVDAWTAALTTATGSLRVSCGDFATAAACPDPTWSGLFRNSFDVGDELYVPASGHVAKAADITVISQPPWGNWEAGIAALIKAAEHQAGAQ